MTDVRRLPADVPEQVVWPIAGAHAVTLDAITAGLALIRSIVPRDEPKLGPIDIVADMFDETAELARSVRVLVRLLVQELATGDLDAASARQRASALGAVTQAVDAARLRVNRARRNTALADAAEIVWEMGLEYHDHDCILGTAANGSDVIAAVPVSPPVAHVYLIGRLLSRAEQFIASQPALAMERAASAWYFSRWSQGTIETDLESTEFSRAVREQEWSLVSRETVALAAPVMASFTGEDDLFDDGEEPIDGDEDPIEIPPRQSFLARALLRSTVGVFDVVDVDGPIMTVRDVDSAATYRVYEHDDAISPAAGFLLLGRIIPFDDELWLRSPGAVMLSQDQDIDRDAPESILSETTSLPTPITLERLISTAVYGARVPVAIRPAPTIKEAQAALAELADVLVDLGLLGDDLDAQPADAATEVDMAALDAVGLGLDDAFAEWIAALSEHAALDTPRAERGRASEKKGKRAKRSGQRRRRR